MLPKTYPSPFADNATAVLKHRLDTHEYNGLSIETCYCYWQCQATGEQFTTTESDNMWLVDMVSGFLAQGGQLSAVKVGWRNFWVDEAPRYSGKPRYALPTDRQAPEQFREVYISPGVVDYQELRAVLSRYNGFVLYYPDRRVVVAAYYPLNGKLIPQDPEFVNLGVLSGRDGVLGTYQEQLAGLRKLFPATALFTANAYQAQGKRQLGRGDIGRAYDASLADE